MDELSQTFPELKPDALARFAAWETLMRDWNSRMNLVSRRDMDHLVSRHLIHALCLTRFVSFAPGARATVWALARPEVPIELQVSGSRHSKVYTQLQCAPQWMSRMVELARTVP